MEIKQIAVIGAGLMGKQIALQCAKYEFTTKMFALDEKEAKAASDWVETYLDGRVEKGKITQEDRESWRSNLEITTSLEEAVKEADIVIEAIIEDIEVKKEYFAKFDKLTKPECILATNSSAIPSSAFAGVTSKPDKVINMHFFNPALVMELVEVVCGEHTSQETADIVMDLSRKIGKDPILLKKEIEGFVVTTVVATLQQIAFKFVDEGYISVKDFDKAVEKGLGHPMGPFRLMDLTGIDLTYRGLVRRQEMTGEKLPQVLIEQYNTGNYGVKTGKGWYDDYDKN